MRSDSKQLGINIVSNYLSFAIYGICNFVIAGFLIRKLGSDAFGIVSILISLTTLIELLGDGVCQGLTKNIAALTNDADMNKKGSNYASASYLWFVGCGVVGAIICLLLAWKVEYIFDIPSGWVSDTKLAMVLMAIRAIVFFPLNVYKGILWGYRRYEMVNFSRIVMIVSRLAFIVIYFNFISISISGYVLMLMGSLLVERFFWVRYKRQVAGGLLLSYKNISWDVFGGLVGFGLVMMVIHIANLIGYEGVKWIIGIELSLADVGGYTLLAMVALLAGELVRSVANAIMPFASKNEATGGDKNKTLALYGTKYSMIVANATCILPLFVFKPFLNIWIGNKYEPGFIDELANMAIPILVSQWLVCMSSTVVQMMTGVGKIKVPAIITMAWAVCGTAIVFVILHWYSSSLWVAVIGTSVARTVGAVAHIVYALNVLKINLFSFISTVFRPILSLVIVTFLISIFLYFFDVYEIKGFLAVLSILLILYFLAIWYITLGINEKDFLVGNVFRKFNYRKSSRV